MSRAKLQRRARLENLFAIHAENWTEERYAIEIGVAQSTISRYLSELTPGWKARCDEGREIRVGKQEKRIDARRHAAWESFLASQEPDKNGVPTCPGEPKWLAQVGDCDNQLAKLYGLDKPREDTLNLKLDLAVTPPPRPDRVRDNEDNENHEGNGAARTTRAGGGNGASA